MPFHCLSDFLAALQDDGELIRVESTVDPVYELAELTRQVAQTPGGGPALLFADVRGSELPAVSNLLGSERRLCRALDAENFDEAAARLAAALQPNASEGWMQSFGRWPQLSQLSGCAPKLVKTGACQHVVYLGSDVALSDLPIPHCWPAETGRSVVAPVYVKDPETGSRHVGSYSLHLVDGNTLAIAWNQQQDACRIAEAYRKSGQQMPVAVALGGDPLLGYVSGAPLPAGIDGVMFAGLLRQKGVELVRGRTVELEIPAEADFVMEGYVDADVPALERCSLATSFGHVMQTENLPVIRITAITRRANPVLPVVIPSVPPSEQHVQRKLSERLALTALRLFVPEIRDISFPECGGVQQLLFVSLHKQFPRHSRQVISALCGQRLCLGTKMIVVVDADVDVQDGHQVWHALSTNVHPVRDMCLLEGPGTVDDPAAPVPGLGSLLAVDATRKLPAENQSRPWPPTASAPAEIQHRVAQLHAELGLTRSSLAVPT